MLAAELTLPGECPKVKLQDNLDYTKVSDSCKSIFKNNIPFRCKQDKCFSKCKFLGGVPIIRP